MKNINKRSYNSLASSAYNYLMHDPLNISLCGENQYTIELSFYMNDSGGDVRLYSQDNLIKISISNKRLSFFAKDLIAFQTDETVLDFLPRQWYALAFAYDGNKIYLYVNGLKTNEYQKTKEGTSEKAQGNIGEALNGYMQYFRIYDSFQSEKQINEDYLSSPSNMSLFSLYLNFMGTELKDSGKNSIKLTQQGECNLVNLAHALILDGNSYVQHMSQIEYDYAAGYTLNAKIYPVKSGHSIYTVFANADLSASSGFTVYLSQNADGSYKVCSDIAAKQKIKLVSTKSINHSEWNDVALVVEKKKVNLLINGEIVAASEEIDIAALKGEKYRSIGGALTQGYFDNKKGFCGYIAYFADFNMTKSVAELKGYMENHPYIFDNGVSSLYAFERMPLQEIISMSPVTLGGFARIGFAENTNALNDPQDVKYYIPNTLPDDWDKKTEEEKWKIDYTWQIIAALLGGAGGSVGGIIFANTRSSVWRRIVSALGRKFDGFRLLDVNTMSNTEIVQQIQNFIVDNPGAIAETATSVVAGQAGSLTAASLTALPASLASLLGVIGSSPEVVVTSALASSALAVTVAIAISSSNNRPKPDPKPDEWIGFDLSELYFNHSGDPVIGAINVRKDGGNPLSPPEWKGSDNAKKPAQAVYIINKIGSNPFVKVKLTLNVSPDMPDTVKAKIKFSSDKNILKTAVSDTITFKKGVAQEVTLYFDSQPIKNITKYGKVIEAVQWRFEVSGPSGYTGDCFILNTNHEFYFLLDTPSLPWTIGDETYDPNEQYYPRLDTLEVLNGWIKNTSVSSGISGISAAVTNGLNGSKKFKYHKEGGAPFYSNIFMIKDSVAYSFYIDSFVFRYNQELEEDKFINCLDCAIIVATFSNLHGSALNHARLIAFTGQGFKCNQIIHIGDNDDQWARPFEGRSGGFSYHQVSINREYIYDNNTFKDMPVHDACLKVDSGEYPSKEKSQGKTKIAKLPCQMPFSSKNSGVVDITEPFTKNSYQERLVAQSQQCKTIDQLLCRNWFFNVFVPEVKDVSIGEQDWFMKMKEQDSRFNSYLRKINANQKIVEEFTPNFLSINLDKNSFNQEQSEDGRFKYYWISNYTHNLSVECFTMPDIEAAHNQLYSMYALFSSGNVPIAEEVGLRLGDLAFLDNPHNPNVILFCRANVVVKVSRNTDKRINLFSFAQSVDTQISDLID